MRLTIVALALVLAAVNATAEISYVDSTGWQIIRIGAAPVEKMVYGYADAKQQGADFRDTFAVLNYLYFHDPSQFAAVIFHIPDNLILVFDQDSRITVTTICDGDTVVLTSTQLVVSNTITINTRIGSRRILGDTFWITSRVHRDDPAPATRIYSNMRDLFTTEKGNLVVFVRFDLDRCRPENGVSLTASGITAIRR